MKIKSYERSNGVEGLFKQNCLLISDGYKSCPLIYFQRPKWIKDDKQWEVICNSIQISLPLGYEIGEEY